MRRIICLVAALAMLAGCSDALLGSAANVALVAGVEAASRAYKTKPKQSPPTMKLSETPYPSKQELVPVQKEEHRP